MKIIILLLMISTQAQAMANTAEGGLNSFTVEQCNQIANISKRTIKAAIIGVPIAEVINKFTDEKEFDIAQLGGDAGHTAILAGADATEIQFTDGAVDSSQGDSSVAIADSAGHSLESSGNYGAVRLIEGPTGLPSQIRAIYKTVGQIKTKYGQVRPQDRERLNNRVEQLLLECRKTAFVTTGTNAG